MAILLLIVGLVLVFVGANLLVSGATSLARRWGVSDLVIGLTIVAFGTSAPELAVTVLAAGTGRTDIAIANVLGSNTFNILLILGLSAILCPLTVHVETVWKQIPLALLAVVLVGVMGNDGVINGAGASAITRTDGLVLLAFFVIFLYYTFGILQRDRAAGALLSGGEVGASAAVEAGGSADGASEAAAGSPAPRTRSAWVSGGMVLGGLVLLVVGARFAVDAAVELARWVGLSERVIGLTLVAAGTSVPELATSAVAAWRRNSDIAVANVVGSNLFNVFCILGIGATIAPLPFAPAMNLDVLAATVASGLLFIVMFTGRLRHHMERWEGIVCLGLYVTYVAVLLARP